MMRAGAPSRVSNGMPAVDSSTPATTSLVYQLVSSGASRPTVRVCPEASLAAFEFAT